MTLLQDLKNEIYRELNVDTTAQVKELYPSYNLRRTSDWLELKAELAAKATDTQSEAPTKPYCFPESETVLTGKTGELTEAFPATPGASTGENSDASVETIASDDDLEPDLSESDAPMAPVPVALWDFMPGHNLVGVLSPWAHYLQWLDRLYTKASTVYESVFGSYQNA